MRLNIEDVEFVDSVTLVADPSLRRQLKKAQAEGRLHPQLAILMGVDTGTFPCFICGMLHWLADDARDCCTVGERKTRDRCGGWKNQVAEVSEHMVLFDAIMTAGRAAGCKNRVETERKFGLYSGYSMKARFVGFRITEEPYKLLREMFPDGIPGITMAGNYKRPNQNHGKGDDDAAR